MEFKTTYLIFKLFLIFMNLNLIHHAYYDLGLPDKKIRNLKIKVKTNTVAQPGLLFCKHPKKFNKTPIDRTAIV